MLICFSHALCWICSCAHVEHMHSKYPNRIPLCLYAVDAANFDENIMFTLESFQHMDKILSALCRASFSWHQIACKSATNQTDSKHGMSFSNQAKALSSQLECYGNSYCTQSYNTMAAEALSASCCDFRSCLSSCEARSMMLTNGLCGMRALP